MSTLLQKYFENFFTEVVFRSRRRLLRPDSIFILHFPTLWGLPKLGNYQPAFDDCVSVNTAIPPAMITVQRGETGSIKPDWPTSAKVAQQERLVTAGPGRKATAQRLEHQQGFSGQFGVATPASTRLRTYLSLPYVRCHSEPTLPQEHHSAQNRTPIPRRAKARFISNESRKVNPPAANS
jgi:hypothetical protein